jgi:hypothetical protein
VRASLDAVLREAAALVEDGGVLGQGKVSILDLEEIRPNVEEECASNTWSRFALWAIERKATLLSIRIAQILFNQSGVQLQNLSADEETFARCRAAAQKIFASRGRQLRNICKEERTLTKRVQAFQFKP